MGTIPKEEEGIPSWLDQEFIASALKCGEPTTDKSSVQLKSVCKMGGGFLSETYRAVAKSRALGEACDRETSLIVKNLPSVGGFLKELAESGVFTKEKVAYGSFLPAVDASLQATEGPMWRALAPKSYQHGSKPTSFLVIEDLLASGFRMVDQGVCLDVDECRAVLRNLARMHAASVAQIHHQQYADKQFQEALIFNRRLVETFQDKQPEKTNPSFPELDDREWFHKYKDKLVRKFPHLMVETVDVVEQCQVDFRVMVHGDLHKNNMMFREDSEGLQVRFYDFQGIHIGSPAEDLQYFLHTSASVEVLRDHVDELLAEYHGALQQTLRALGLRRQADDYPLEALQADMDRFGAVAVFVTFHILPRMLKFFDADFAVDTTDAESDEKATKFYEDCFKNEIYIEYLEHLVPVFDSKGFLD